jgi:DNA-binding MarR family transcriptional regulator
MDETRTEGEGEPGTTYSPEFLVELLRRLSVTSARHVSMIAKRMGLGFTEVVALHHLYDSGGLTAGELGRLMFLTKGAVTQLADRLERLGYLERRPNPADRRSLLLVETRAGEEEALRQMDPFMREAQQGIVALSPEDREVVGRFLEGVMRAMDPPAEAGKDAD